MSRRQPLITKKAAWWNPRSRLNGPSPTSVSDQARRCPAVTLRRACPFLSESDGLIACICPVVKGQAPTHALQQKCILGPLLASDMKEVRKPSGPAPGLDRRSSYTRACDRLVSFRQRRVVDVPMVAAGVVGRVIRLIKRGTGAEAFDEVRIGQREGG
jgi:hypothetical protein